MSDLLEARLRRWWCEQPIIRTIDEARAFVQDVGFAVLFGGDRPTYPCLREISRDDEAEMTSSGMGEDFEAMWSWKDSLPAQGKAWLGRFLGSRQTLLSPDLLADLYEYPGEPDDFTHCENLSPSARNLAEMLLVEGAMTTRSARSALGMKGRDFDRLVAELGRSLLITGYGIDESGPGWPASVIELTARVFDVPGDGGREERDASATARFLDTMVQATPRELQRAFRWDRDRAHDALRRATGEP
ncbi:AlkZ-related protein [Nocardiopsis alba]|uniref:AlkZ-related protein n=1 Tax=Nocardiopsis alba TaxID=53437 RepID=UPI0035D6DBB5